MIIHSLCNTCLQKFDIMVLPEDVPLMKEISDEEGVTCECPRLCGGRLSLFGDELINQMRSLKGLKDAIKISAEDLYKAVHGAGLPDEIPTNSSIISALLKSQSIKDVDLELVDGKLYLHEIWLADGSKIHLSSGQKGAQVLKVTKESTDERSRRSSRSASKNRVQDRHAGKKAKDRPKSV